MFTFEPVGNLGDDAVIKVIGVGGGVSSCGVSSRGVGGAAGVAGSAAGAVKETAITSAGAGNMAVVACAPCQTSRPATPA